VVPVTAAGFTVSDARRRMISRCPCPTENEGYAKALAENSRTEVKMVEACILSFDLKYGLKYEETVVKYVIVEYRLKNVKLQKVMNDSDHRSKS